MTLVQDYVQTTLATCFLTLLAVVALWALAVTGYVIAKNSRVTAKRFARTQNPWT